MTQEQLENGEVLIKTIKTTESQLENLADLLLHSESKFNRKDNKYHDGLYNLYISEYRDGDSRCAVLSRYGGNVELLKVIIVELERQLENYKDEFRNL